MYDNEEEYSMNDGSNIDAQNGQNSIDFYEVLDENIEKEKKENEINKKIEIKELTKIKIVCPNCKHFPLIKFKNNNKIDIICNCKKIKNFNIREFKQDYMTNRDIEILCKKHNQKFIFYCLDCNQDICEKCFETNEHQNQETQDYMKEDSKIEDLFSII